MSVSIKLKKGFDIKLVGQAEKKLATIDQPETYAVKPTDFVGFERPKVLVRPGDTVKAGDPVFFDRGQESVMYVTPVSGEVVEVKRGAKRKLLEVIILADKEIQYKNYDKVASSDIPSLNVEDVKSRMLESGVWPQIVRRPFAVVADPEDQPRAIFVSAFDSSPLAPDYDFIFKGQEKYLQAGIDILKKFTNGGPVHVSTNADEASSTFSKLSGVTFNQFSGPHPAGNVGVQIHHISPVVHGEDCVWTVNPFGLIQIGKLFLEGVYDAKKVVAVTGSEVENPEYYETLIGARLDKITSAKVKSDNVRVISGNVLTGESIGKDGYLGYYDHQVTVIPEGNRPRFVLKDGWLSFVTDRLSIHKAFGLLGSTKKEYALDTSLNGEERAFVITGSFEKVVPMDIYPLHLIKAVMAQDFEEMEALGIYEISEEDFALCEFIDVSKHEVQRIVREGLDMLRMG